MFGGLNIIIETHAIVSIGQVAVYSNVDHSYNLCVVHRDRNTYVTESEFFLFVYSILINDCVTITPILCLPFITRLWFTLFHYHFFTVSAFSRTF